MRIKIVADSSADIKSIEGMEFSSVPLTIMAGEKEYVDNEKLNLEQMIKELKVYKGKSSTACPSHADWCKAFDGADVVFCVTITSGLSGSYNAACLAKSEYEETNPGKKVYVVDSLSAGPELILIIEKIRELLLSGMDCEEVYQRVIEYKTNKTHLGFMLESLTNLANNGRVSHTVAKIAGIIGIRLVGLASQQGTLEPTDKPRGAKKALLSVMNEMKKLKYAGGKVRIAHCMNREAAKELENMIKSQHPDADIETIHTGGLCSFYAEVGGMLVGFEA